MTGVLATTLLSVPLLASPAHAQLAEDRPAVAPNVFFPAFARSALVLRTAGKRPGSTIMACGGT